MIANDRLIHLATTPVFALVAFTNVTIGMHCLSFALIGGNRIIIRLGLFGAGLILAFLELLY